MKNRKNRSRKTVSAALAASMTAGLCIPAYAADADKEEVVYVRTDAAGSVTDLTVSDHLLNREGLDTLEDVSSLTGIENVKGEETFTQGADGALTWEADGRDIYYQGTSTQELPFDVKLTYYLDGEEIAPEDLIGKSGRVTIRMDYENKLTDGLSRSAE